MPVDQTGETILFVIDDGFVEAHIQIQYDPETEAQQFAWVVPVTALPEFTVGSQQLFANLLNGTVPVYGFDAWNEPCDFGDEGGDGFGGDGCDGGGEAGGDDGGIRLDIGGGMEPPPEPEVVLATTVGAFEVFVLDGGTVEGVMTWLGDNGFVQDPAAEPILAEYLAEGHMFAAFRLAAQADAAEIHPITLRFAGDEPCVPIRLTRIAAQDDMEIRAMFLAEDRVASSNYRHVNLNPLKLDWIGVGANYREVVTRAVDEPGADGHAFVTEYAGTSEVVSREDLMNPLWDAALFEMLDPAEAVMTLVEQELVGFGDEGICQGLHPLIEGIIANYLSVPDGTPLDLLCTDPLAYAELVDPMAWDGVRFAEDFQERIIDPGMHAEQLLENWPMLTRLYTTISPHEMLEDPMFHPTPELPEVPGLLQLGDHNTFCNGDASFGLPDGRLVALPIATEWPDIAPDDMPWAETIEYLPAAGAPVVEVDNRDLIDSLLDTWNMDNGPPQSPVSASCHDDDGGVSIGGTGTSGSGGSAGANDDGGGEGCGCQSSGTAGWWTLALLVGLARLRRRD